MSFIPNPQLRPIHAAVLRAEALFARLLEEAAPPPLPPADPRDVEYLRRVDRYERFIPSSEVKTIAGFYYMLAEYGIHDVSGIRQLAELHNRRIDALLEKRKYLRRWGLNATRLEEARFGGGALRHLIQNFVDAETGRIGFDSTNLARFLVEFANRTEVNEALRVLGEHDFFVREADEAGQLHCPKTGYNATLYISTGLLESIFARHLAELGSGTAIEGSLGS